MTGVRVQHTPHRLLALQQFTICKFGGRGTYKWENFTGNTKEEGEGVRIIWEEKFVGKGNFGGGSVLGKGMGGFWLRGGVGMILPPIHCYTDPCTSVLLIPVLCPYDPSFLPY